MATPRPPTTISTVAMKPNRGAPLGKSILAVLTGFGQRRTLLSPLIKKRQPKMTRRTASVINTTDEGSKLSSCQFVKQMTQTIVSRRLAVNYRCLYPWSNCCQICQLNKWISIVSRVEIIYNLAIYEFQLH